MRQKTLQPEAFRPFSADANTRSALLRHEMKERIPLVRGALEKFMSVTDTEGNLRFVRISDLAQADDPKGDPLRRALRILKSAVELVEKPLVDTDEALLAQNVNTLLDMAMRDISDLEQTGWRF